MLHHFSSNIILRKWSFFSKQWCLNHVIFLLHIEFATLFVKFLLLKCLNFLQIERLLLKESFEFFEQKTKWGSKSLNLEFLEENTVGLL